MASKRGLRRKLGRLCQRKTRYETKQAAQAALDTLMRYATNLQATGPMHVYACPNGGHYHLGHLPGHGPVARNRASMAKNA